MIRVTQKKLDFFPLRKVLKGYGWTQAKADLKAGLNVSLLDFPQAMAYALLAGFPVAFGVYASAIASIVGPFFASSRYVILGATNATAILILSSFLTLDFTMEERLLALPLLVFMVGAFMIIGALLHLGGLIKYVSRTVIIGYITAAALLIIVNQLNTVLGTPEIHAATFFEVLKQNYFQWDMIRWEAVLVATLTAGIYLLVKQHYPRWPAVAVTLIGASFITYGLQKLGVSVTMLDSAPVGVWPVTVPSFDFEMINQLGGVAIAIAFLAILESSSIAKTLAARSGRRLDLNQQMLSMGFSNMSCAFGSGMPISGSLTRSMLNYSSGAQTGISSIFSGIVLVIGILLLGPLLGYIPRPSLATMVIFVGISLINSEHVRVVVRSTNSDAAVFFITFVGGLLFPLNVAIYLGAASSIVLFLRKISEPRLVQYSFNSRGEMAEATDVKKFKNHTPEISIVHVEGELFFGSTDIFLDQTRLICESPNLKVIILRVRNAHQLDATSAMAIEDLIRFAHEKERHFIVSGANDQVEHVFREAGVMKILGENNFFSHTAQNPNLSTRRALKRAQEMIGEEKANIILFTAPHPDKKESAEVDESEEKAVAPDTEPAAQD